MFQGYNFNIYWDSNIQLEKKDKKIKKKEKNEKKIIYQNFYYKSQVKPLPECFPYLPQTRFHARGSIQRTSLLQKFSYMTLNK